ncbi:MAG: P22 phage major capsid protein family protein [Dehalococcoidia bacterium]|jgi:hypothetical protein
MAVATNTFISVKEFSRRTLMRVHELLVFPNLIHKDFSDDFIANKGATIQVEKPLILTASEFVQGTGVVAQDTEQESVEVTLNHLADVTVEFTALQRAVNAGEDRVAKFIESGAIALAQKINSDGLLLYKDIPYYSGAAASTPDALSDFADAALVLDNHNVPQGMRKGLWNPAAYAKFRVLDAVVGADKSGTTDALRKGEIGNISGLENYMSQAVKTHTTVGAGTTIAIDNSPGGYSEGDTEIHIDGLSAAFAVGDLFTIAGHTGAQYVVTVAGDLATADQDITIYPALTADVADGIELTPIASHVANLAFHENAFAFVTRPLVLPSDKEAYVTSYNDISMRVVRGYDMTYKKDVISIDCLYGFKTMYPELACRILG